MSITILKKRGGPGATTKPRPDHGFPPAEPVLFTPGRCFFIRRVSLSSFSCAFVVHFFLTFFFWLIVAFRFRMQLRPRPRRGSPLGGIARRGSVSAVTLLHAVRRRRLTRLIFDRGGGSRRPASDEFQNVAGSRGEKCRRRGSWPSRRSSRCRPSRRSLFASRLFGGVLNFASYNQYF